MDRLKENFRGASTVLRSRDIIRTGSDVACEVRQSPEWHAANALDEAEALCAKLQALVDKWGGMTCRTKCAQVLREVLEATP